MPERLRYSYALQWRERPARYPIDGEYAEWYHFGEEQLARREHAEALFGRWVKAGQHTASVSDLYETRWVVDEDGRVVRRPVDRPVADGDDVQPRLPVD